MLTLLRYWLIPGRIRRAPIAARLILLAPALFCLLVLATLVTVIWTLFDRKRAGVPGVGERPADDREQQQAQQQADADQQGLVATQVAECRAGAGDEGAALRRGDQRRFLDDDVDLRPSGS